MAKLEDKADDGAEELQGSAERSLRRLSTILGGVKFDAKEEQVAVEQREVVPRVSSWPHRPILLCDNNEGGPLSLGTPFDFETDLFKGKMLVRLQGVPSDDPAADAKYFDGRQRRFQAIVQGRFKREIRVSELMTGHVFARPLKNLPPKWLVAVAERMIMQLAPSMQVQLRQKNPQALSILAATSQVRMRSSEERSDKLRRRVNCMSTYVADTSVRNVATPNSAIVFNIINTSSFATRFARRRRFGLTSPARSRASAPETLQRRRPALAASSQRAA